MPMADIRAALKARRDPGALALRARLAEVADRYAKRRRARPVPFAALRMRDLEIIFLDRYGGPLPDDDAGLGDARVAIHHVASLPGNQENNVFSWLARWAPWMPADQMVGLVDEAIEHPLRWKADTLGWALQLTAVDRARLGVTTIGAFDLGRSARAQRRKDQKRRRAEAERRAAGAKTRAEYLAGSLSRTKPWKAERISRRTWERRRKATAPSAAVASPCAANLPSGWARTCDISTGGALMQPAGAENLEEGRHPEDAKPKKNIFCTPASQKEEEGSCFFIGMSGTVPSHTGSLGRQGASTPRGARPSVPATEVDHFAALNRYQQKSIQEGNHTLSRQNVDNLWNRFCAARRGVLPGGWETSWQIAVSEEGRAVTQFQRRRAEMLTLMAKGKAGTEALLAKHLTPSEREAEKRARMAVLEVRLDDRERATFVRNAVNERHRLRRELETRQATPDEVERTLREHAVASCIEQARRGYGLPSDPSIVQEAKHRSLEEAAAGPFPEDATRWVREMFEGNGASDAEKRIEAKQKRLEAERARLVEQHRRNADHRLLLCRRERREREEREC
jgi:hypothetical protein